MPGQAAERVLEYHRKTKHSFESVRRSAHFLDWDNEPALFKEYRDLTPAPLPPWRGTGVPWHRAVAESATGEGDRSLNAAALSHLLHHAAGVSPSAPRWGGEHRFRVYASAGALYPNEAYVVAGDLPDLDPGVYHYAPLEHGLTALRSGDFRGNLGLGDHSPGDAAVVLTGIPWRTAWKYTERGFRHLYWDAGMMLANLLGSAAALGIRTRVVLGFVDGDVERLLGVDGRTEFPLCVVALGDGDASGPVDVQPLSHAVAPISARPTEFDLIVEARDAIRLGSPSDVERFRTGAARRSPPTPEPPSADRPAEAELSDDPLEEVVRRRGSSRRFEPRGFPATEYAAIASAATSGVPGDWGPATTLPHVGAAALDGLPPGVYRWSRRFEPIREGPVRAEVAHLCLDQRIGGDAAVATFLMAELDAVVGAVGARGYAAAQLDAAVMAGRLYLGAYGQCLGASGTTFYDDEVRGFFGTQAEPMLTVLMGPEGARPSIRGCRQPREERVRDALGGAELPR